MKPPVVAVIGAGTMGHGIAYAAALAGCDVRLTDDRAAALPQAKAKIEDLLAGGLKRGKLTESDAVAVRQRLQTDATVRNAITDADVVIEGDAARVTEPGALARIARAWADNGWPAEPDDGGPGITAPFNPPSQGPPPWNVYRIQPRSAIVVLATEPGGLTRFRF